MQRHLPLFNTVDSSWQLRIKYCLWNFDFLCTVKALRNVSIIVNPLVCFIDVCGRLCCDNQADLNLPLQLYLCPVFARERAFLLLVKSKMRHFLVLVSLILFAAAEDPVVNDNVPDVGQPGKQVSVFHRNPNQCRNANSKSEPCRALRLNKVSWVQIF